ncbi:MAG: hypothetical protein SYR96_03215 [Actinomycetota bacterium]|nr:hypothetical protein [Actinomycetota bacterium]
MGAGERAGQFPPRVHAGGEFGVVERAGRHAPWIGCSHVLLGTAVTSEQEPPFLSLGVIRRRR